MQTRAAGCSSWKKRSRYEPTPAHFWFGYISVGDVATKPGRPRRCIRDRKCRGIRQRRAAASRRARLAGAAGIEQPPETWSVFSSSYKHLLIISDGERWGQA